MEITARDANRFQDTWREEFAEEISADEARMQIGRLDALYRLLYGPERTRRGDASEGEENANLK